MGGASRGWFDRSGVSFRLRLLTALLAFATSFAIASPIAGARDYSEQREECRRYEPQRQPFFGDTHVHTVYSFDANGQDTRNTPRDAYRFAKGERVGLQPYAADGTPGRSAQLTRPLDFTVLSDHSELLGEIRMCSTPGAPGFDSDFCWIYQTFRASTFQYLATRNLLMRKRFGFCGPDGELCKDQAKIVWRDIQDAAEEAYDRSKQCSFTSFVGYEWTATVGNGQNLHRNVVFKNANVPEYAPSWTDTPSAYELWEHLQKECVDGVEGCDALTIPHNSNLSGPGLMFASAKLTGPQDIDLPVEAAEAELRQRWEPLVEIMQHKGDSECLPGGDTKDEVCGFEKLAYNSFAGVGRIAEQGLDSTLATFGTGGPMDPDPRAMVRGALKKGILLESELGENPLKYGIIASTDTHLGTPGLVAEGDAKGHGGAGSRISAGLPDDLEFNPGGLAVLWAEENSRDSLFSAMQRREAYGTSGTRPVVRFFGGWDFDQSMCEKQDFADRGYAEGVPMGSDLPKLSGRQADPTFAVLALQDPGTDASPGTPLARVQIVKGWVEGGETREKVVDVVGEKNRASVDLETCETTGEGHRQLCTVWRDSEFDPDQSAFYYARVLENPTCRWSQHLCVEAGIDCDDPSTIANGFEGCCSERHQPVIQERAWTSPIWYEP
ncbi:MAG: hypothetical protein CL908_00030 [Deltaproteobacteria bacterium]|nr:hypothetical protein [Deltaproteobacteria bacterium]